MKILLATDGSESARAAQDLVLRIHWPRPLEIELLHVVQRPQFGITQHEYGQFVERCVADMQAKAEELLQREAERFAGIDAAVATRCVVGHTADAIIRAAEDSKADLVVVGSRGLSPTKRFFLGSVSRHVANQAPCSVLVVRPTDLTTRPDSGLRVVYAGDSSPPARYALEELAAIQWGPGVEITALTVTPPPFSRRARTSHEEVELWEQLQAQAADELEKAASLLGKTGAQVHTKSITGENPADEILTFLAREKADLVVVGDRGWNAIAKLLLGSVSHRVLTHAPCSVWVAR